MNIVFYMVKHRYKEKNNWYIKENWYIVTKSFQSHILVDNYKSNEHLDLIRLFSDDRLQFEMKEVWPYEIVDDFISINISDKNLLTQEYIKKELQNVLLLREII